MGIQKNNTTALTVSEQISNIKGKVATWFTTSLFEDCDTFINDKATLDDNLIGEATLIKKRGGANRIRVYVNKLKDTDILDVSIRYGNNMPYHTEALTASHNMSKRIQDVAKDGKTESRIRVMSVRFSEWLKAINSITETEKLDNVAGDNVNEELKKADKAEKELA